MRTWLNSRTWPCQRIDGWDMARAVSMVADGLTAHESTFANVASARAPVFGSNSRQHRYLTSNVERGNFHGNDVIQIQAAHARNYWTMPAELRYLIRLPEIPRARFHWE